MQLRYHRSLSFFLSFPVESYRPTAPYVLKDAVPSFPFSLPLPPFHVPFPFAICPSVRPQYVNVTLSACVNENQNPDRTNYYPKKTKKKKPHNLEQAVNLARLSVNIDVEVARCGGQTRNGLDIGSKRV